MKTNGTVVLEIQTSAIIEANNMSDGTPPGYMNDEKMAGDEGGAHDDAADTRQDIYQTLDPLDPRKVSLDIFEMYCHEMVNTPSVGRRAYLINKMKYMMTRLIGHQYPYGRLYNRTCIANITARVCARQPYSIDDASDADDGYNCQLADCLIDFPPEKWKKIILQFEDLRESLLRKDAVLIVLPEELSDEDDGNTQDEAPMEDDSVNPLLASSKEFTETYNKILNSMKFHMCLSHIQPQLENAMLKENFADEEAVVIPNDDILAFDNEIEEAFGGHDNSKHAQLLNSLLVQKRGSLHLKSFDEIKDIYVTNMRLFDLARFQNTFLKLIRSWSEMVLPVAELTKVGYGSTTPAVGTHNKENISSLGSAFATRTTNQQREQTKRPIDQAGNDKPEEEEEEKDVGGDDGEGEKEDNLGRLKRTREALMKNVEDPLDACVAKAKSARTRSTTRHVTAESESTVSTPSFLKKKKSSYKIAFSDSDNEDDDDNAKGKAEETAVEMDDLEDSAEEDEGVKLSKVPKRFKPKVDAAPEKIAVSKATKPKKGKRKRFTDSEDAAIRNGVERFGAGKWSDIKSYYHIDLADRTAVQIKDRWRTLNN